MFRSRVRKSDSCWLWTGNTNGKYGVLHANEVTALLAHRVAWSLDCGAIPAGMFVCHKCDNPLCVRPDHLFIGSHADNMRDMREKGRSGGPRGATDPERRMRGDSHANAKLSEAAVLSALVRFVSSDVTNRDLAAELGVRPSTLAQILRGDRWSHVAAPDGYREMAKAKLIDIRRATFAKNNPNKRRAV